MVVIMSEEMREYTYKWYPDKYDDVNEPVLKITKSSFGSFQWCPKKYEFSYPIRLPQATSEAMIKGTVVHNSREDFFNEFDIKKAENLSYNELVTYNMGLHPIDDYTEMYKIICSYEAERFLDAKTNNKLDEYLPVVNEVLLDAEITIPHGINPKCILERDYVVHLQGIVDRVFIQDGKYIPLEFKTGPWKDYKLTMMRKEMAFYKLLIENATDESLANAGISRDIPITNWGWYYPQSNYIQVEPVKKSSTTAVYRGITNLIKAYELQEFPAKYYYKTCSHCSFLSICPAAQETDWL
jgi:CRISPR/Cas system-associated exonuclease Cas4 (RecB family)